MTSDTFVQAITSFATFDPHKGTPRAWGLGIARRIYAAHCQAYSQQRRRAERLAGRRELAPDARLRHAATPDLAHGTDPASEPEVKT